DPAHEATDVSAAGEDEPVFGLTLLCRVVVFRPFGQQSLQARDIQEPARQRRGRETLDLRSEILASPIERAKPGDTLRAAAALVEDLRRQPVRQNPARKRAGDTVPAKHGLGNGKDEFQQRTGGERITLLKTIGRVIHCSQVAAELVVVKKIIGGMWGRMRAARSKPWIEVLPPPLPDEIEFGDESRVEGAVVRH